MKVAVVILAVAIVGAFAQESADSGVPDFVCTSSNAFVCKLQEVGHHIKYHATKLGSQLGKVGSAVLGSAIDQGKTLLANGAQAVLGTVLEHLNKEGLVGKREESSFLSKVKEHLQAGSGLLNKIKEDLHAAFKKAAQQITGKIADLSALKKVDQDAVKEIDAAIDEFNKKGNKGRYAMAKAITGKIRDIFEAGMDKLRERFGKKVEERAIFGFDSLSDAFEKAKGHLSNLGGAIADTFKPHIDSLKQGIASLGDQAKTHAGNLVNAAKDSFNDLKTKLAGHVDTLKGHAATLGTHATDALNALKAAVSGIAREVASNVADTVKDAVSDVVSN